MRSIQDLLFWPGGLRSDIVFLLRFQFYNKKEHNF